MTSKPLSKGKKSGRSLKVAASGTKVSLGLRVTAGTKASIDAAAAESGRSQSEEATRRIERSFDREGLLPDALKLAYGELGLILLVVAINMERAGRFVAYTDTKDVDAWKSETWMANPTAYDAAVQEAHRILELFRPKGEITPNWRRKYAPNWPQGPRPWGDASPFALDAMPPPESDLYNIWRLISHETIWRAKANMENKKP